VEQELRQCAVDAGVQDAGRRSAQYGGDGFLWVVDASAPAAMEAVSAAARAGFWLLINNIHRAPRYSRCSCSCTAALTETQTRSSAAMASLVNRDMWADLCPWSSRRLARQLDIFLERLSALPLPQPGTDSPDPLERGHSARHSSPSRAAPRSPLRPTSPAGRRGAISRPAARCAPCVRNGPRRCGPCFVLACTRRVSTALFVACALECWVLTSASTAPDACD